MLLAWLFTVDLDGVLRMCTVGINLGLVVQRPSKVDNAIHWINHYPMDSVIVLLTLIHWIVRFIWAQLFKSSSCRGCPLAGASTLQLNLPFSGHKRTPSGPEKSVCLREVSVSGGFNCI